MSGPEVVTVLFTDLVGSTEIVQRLGDDAAEEFRRTHFALLRRTIARHRGQEVKNLGDGIMVVFGSAVDALHAAVDIQEAVREDNRSAGDPLCHVRIGLHAGEPTREGGDYFGTPVIVAKRLCDASGPDQILVSELVVGLAGSRGSFRFQPVGPLRLKGLTAAVPAAVVAWWPDDEDDNRPPPTPPVRRLVTRPATLAPPPDAFVGRDSEMAMLAELLGPARLVTLTGPGGIGKTRLSAHLVDAVAHRYPDGVWCCPLASVNTDEEVAPTVASALLVERRAGVGLEERIVEFLAPKCALVVLDNCEQVVDGAGALSAAILGGSSRVDVLATSREPLGVSGEHRVSLNPLAVPDQAGGLGSAVTLFAERAAAASPGFQVDDNREWVREVCRRVDGLPLAIELAAARVATRTVAEIAADVGERLDELSAGRGRAERHRSVHAVVEWSYDLLDDDAQRFFDQLAVFAGGWRADAATAVAAPWSSGRVLDQLDQLVDQSLVTARPDDQVTRYALLEPIRAYATQRLAPRQDHDEVRDRHAGFFLTLAEAANQGLRTSEEAVWVARLNSELANLRAAHGWLLHRGDADRSLRLVGALAWYGFPSGVSEVYRWAEEAAERFAGTEHPGLAVAWGAAASGAWLRGDLARAQTLSEMGEAAARDAPGSTPLLAQMAGVVALFRGDFEEAAAHCRRSADLSLAAGDDYNWTYARGSCALALAYAGRTDEACRMADEVIEVAISRGNSSMRALAHYYAGEVRLETDATRAAALLKQSLVEAARIGNRFILGAAGLSSVSLEARTGDPFSALARYPDLIEHWQRSGAWNQQWLTIRTLVETLARTGHPEPAAVLHAALGASSTASPVVGADAIRLATVVDALRDQLGEDAFVRHQAHGAALGDAGALAYAVETLRTILGTV